MTGEKLRENTRPQKMLKLCEYPKRILHTSKEFGGREEAKLLGEKMKVEFKEFEWVSMATYLAICTGLFNQILSSF